MEEAGKEPQPGEKSFKLCFISLKKHNVIRVKDRQIITVIFSGKVGKVVASNYFVLVIPP